MGGGIGVWSVKSAKGIGTEAVTAGVAGVDPEVHHEEEREIGVVRFRVRHSFVLKCL